MPRRIDMPPHESLAREIHSPVPYDGSAMLHIPILRNGTPYTSIDQVEIVHHATGEPVARVSLANPGLITRDVARMDHDVLEQFTVRELLELCRRAAELFM